jgi:hypothetical protein
MFHVELQLMNREVLAYAMAAIGLGCAVVAAFIQGGVVAALSAASAGALSLASLLGLQVRAAAAAPKQ